MYEFFEYVFIDQICDLMCEIDFWYEVEDNLMYWEWINQGFDYLKVYYDYY